MSGRAQRTKDNKGKGRASATSRSAVPSIYQEMLSENLASQPDVSDRPLKRRRTGKQSASNTAVKARKPLKPPPANVSDDDDVAFEDVFGSGAADADISKQQTAYRDTDDDSENSDAEWAPFNFDFDGEGEEETSGDLVLNLTKKEEPKKPAAPRRKAANSEEKSLRLQIHKMHVLCMLYFVERRNRWCNDYNVKKALKPLLTKKMAKFLKPDASYSQFARTNSLKRGLEEFMAMWNSKFKVTERGLRLPLWADDEETLKNYKLQLCPDTCHEKSDFLIAAKELQGSRDVSAQLCVALLRSIGVECRLVCSLQVLPFGSGGFRMNGRLGRLDYGLTKALRALDREVSPEPFEVDASNYKFAEPPGASAASGSSPISAVRRRLGHPNAAGYNIPDTIAPLYEPATSRVDTPWRDSWFPVFWIEVMDEAHTKWMPFDPIVTKTVAKPSVFEPPASHDLNCMAYVIAFEEDGSARDVTQRYTKAYSAKTRRIRVESTPGGHRWWKKTMSRYERSIDNKSVFDDVEDDELAAATAREPMPKNIVDFKDHPVYALERHLKRNEILVGNKEVGKVTAGRDTSKPGQKKLESVFRRRDVKVVRSSDAWYRLGRDIKMGEIPVKTVEAKKRPDIDDDELDERAGTNLYTEEQTELYVAPPIVNGRVPKNSFGNLDVYVPSMVPAGGVHLKYDDAVLAARLLGIDYAPALTGFTFRGRHGTAVLNGIVVALEYREAVEAVIAGLQDEKARLEEENRSRTALRFWRRFLLALRIRERIHGYDIEGELEETSGVGRPQSAQDESQDDDGSGTDSDLSDEDYGGGGFLPE